MKKRLAILIIILFIIIIFSLFSFVINNSLLGSNNCIKIGGKPFEDKPYTIEDIARIKKSCCFGLTPYSPDKVVFGNNSSCQPFYYETIDLIKKMILIFLNFYFWLYSIISLFVIYLIYWLIKKNKKHKNIKFL